MIEGLLIAVLIVAAASLVVQLLALRARGGAGPGSAESIGALESRLVQQLGATGADLAARLERVSADLRQEVADRISTDGQALRSAISTELQSGRTAQDARLGDTVARLEQKFDALATVQAQSATQSRQELADALARGRGEMTETLTRTTRALEEKLQGVETRTAQGLDAIRGRVEERLSEIGRQVQEKLDQNVRDGFAQFEKVQTHLRAAEEQLRNVGALGSSINDLNSLLKLPHLRGRFGEESLERLLADFLPAHLYERQSQMGDGRRPDVIIRVGDRMLPIDSKFPREQVLPLFESQDPEVLKGAREELARVIREQARGIAGYVNVAEGTTSVAFMYLPSETLWYEVVQNRELSEHLARLGVFPVSPNTLMMALHAISLTYKWYRVAAGFEETRRELAAAQRSFEFFQKQFEGLGRSLQKAQDAYSTASTHLGRYQNRVAAMTADVEVPDEPADAPSLPPGDAVEN